MVAVATVVALTAGPAIWHRKADASKANVISSQTPNNEKWTLSGLLALKSHLMEQMDIGLMNLLCAEGLRGSENLDLDKSLERLDEMTTHVRQETDRNMHRFRSNPEEYENSEPYYRTALQTSLQMPDPRFPGGGMPPDPALWNLPRDVAWMMWRQQLAQRRQKQLEGVPDPTPGPPMPIQPFGNNNFGLPPSQQNR